MRTSLPLDHGPSPSGTKIGRYHRSRTSQGEKSEKGKEEEEEKEWLHTCKIRKKIHQTHHIIKLTT